MDRSGSRGSGTGCRRAASGWWPRRPDVRSGTAPRRRACRAAYGPAGRPQRRGQHRWQAGRRRSSRRTHDRVPQGLIPAGGRLLRVPCVVGAEVLPGGVAPRTASPPASRSATGSWPRPPPAPGRTAAAPASATGSVAPAAPAAAATGPGGRRAATGRCAAAPRCSAPTHRRPARAAPPGGELAQHRPEHPADQRAPGRAGAAATSGGPAHGDVLVSRFVGGLRFGAGGDQPVGRPADAVGATARRTAGGPRRRRRSCSRPVIGVCQSSA